MLLRTSTLGERVLARIDILLEDFARIGRVEKLATVDVGHQQRFIYAAKLGPDDPTKPVLVLSGAVHGLEVIGAEILIEYLTTLMGRLTWDPTIAHLLEHTRLLIVPVVNPGGVDLGRRANPRGVDLMRNAPSPLRPVDATFLLSGQRYSNKLPWYCGPKTGVMEIESQALCDFIERETFEAPAAICVDLHSGFGWENRVWFPYAKTHDPFPALPQLAALKDMLDDAMPYHGYQVEPQSGSYLIEGDLWDYLFDRHHALNSNNCFMPLTLELGSWGWVRKNPRQLFDPHGLFHPIRPHRVRRTLRRHLPLLEFLQRALMAYPRWSELSAQREEDLREQARRLWYSQD